MTQNIYDQEDFYTGYASLPRSIHGLTPTGAPEWPILRSYIPPLHNSSFLDLGCGFGWYSRWAAEQGATTVQGIDISSKMLERARNDAENRRISYQRADLESVVLEDNVYDVVFSSLALHYVVNLKGLVQQVHGTLKPGGSFVFSVEHPTVLAPRSSDPKWMLDDEGKRSWPLNGYLDEGQRERDWLAKGVVKQHRTVARYVKMLISAGFVLRAIEEWGPSIEQIESGECNWRGARERPVYLLVKAVKV